MRSSRMFKRWLTALCLLLIAQTAKAASPSDEALTVLDRAANATRLRSPESAPFVLTGRIILEGLATGSVEGDYRLVWLAPERWREDVSVPGFSQQRVMDGQQGWQRRSTANMPYRLIQLNGLLELTYGATANPKSQVKLLRKESSDGSARACVESTSPGSRRIEKWCFDPVTGIPLSVDLNGKPHRSYREPLAFKDHVFPRVLVQLHEQKAAVTLRVTDVTEAPAQTSELFVRPTEATDWLTCDEARNFELTSEVRAELLNGLKSGVGNVKANTGRSLGHGSHLETAIVGVLDVDGTFKGLQAEGGNSADFDRLVVGILERTKQRPPSCAGKPTFVDMAIPVQFRAL